MADWSIETILDFIKNDPVIQGFLQEHARFEALPRKRCDQCSFEYNVEQEPHICKGV